MPSVEKVKEDRRTRRASNGVPERRTNSNGLLLVGMCAGILVFLVSNSLDRDEADNFLRAESFVGKVKRLSNAGNCDEAIATIVARAEDPNSSKKALCAAVNVLSGVCYAQFEQQNRNLADEIAEFCRSGFWRGVLEN